MVKRGRGKGATLLPTAHYPLPTATTHGRESLLLLLRPDREELLPPSLPPVSRLPSLFLFLFLSLSAPPVLLYQPDIYIHPHSPPIHSLTLSLRGECCARADRRRHDAPLAVRATPRSSFSPGISVNTMAASLPVESSIWWSLVLIIAACRLYVYYILPYVHLTFTLLMLTMPPASHEALPAMGNIKPMMSLSPWPCAFTPPSSSPSILSRGAIAISFPPVSTCLP